MQKVIIFNSNTGDIKATSSQPFGPIYQKYLKDGYRPIGIVDGYNTSVTPPNLNGSLKEYFKPQKSKKS